MKLALHKIISFLLIILTDLSLCYCQVNGGQGDGQAAVQLTNVVCGATNINMFMGGPSDGGSAVQIHNTACVPSNVNPFKGGVSDGGSVVQVINSICVPSNVNPFVGGLSDGQSFVKIINTTCSVINQNPFEGGISDGESAIKIFIVSCPVINQNHFVGGSADGNAVLALTNVTPVQCMSAVLPIELLSFDAILNMDIVDVTWQTASETNSDLFYIEKTRDGKLYEFVTTTKGAGNSSQVLNYKIVDPNPYTGISYYRLTQKDFDGTTHESNLAPIDYEKTITRLFPNPFREGKELTLACSVNSDEQVIFTLRDVLGKFISATVFDAKKGGNTFTISLPSIADGVYYAEIVSAEKTETVKLVVNK